MNLSNAEHLRPVTAEDYLAGEASARHKHEYVDGFVHLMAGGSFNHNLIATNAIGDLHSQLTGTPCRVLNSDSKVHIKSASRTRFYYPDVTVVCGENIRADVYQDRPSVIVEVLSPSTRRIDDGEKREAYLHLESLATYVLLEQSFPAAVVYHRRGTVFQRTEFAGLEVMLPLPGIKAILSLATVYAEVDFDSPGAVRESVAEYE